MKVNANILSEGARAAWPICLGYFPIGIAFGVIAQKAGLNPLEIGLMSLLVFAGSSQFIAISLLSSGASFLAITLTTFIVNLRHFLMSSALAVYLRHTPKKCITLFGYGVTDESFAMNLAFFRTKDWDWRKALVVNHISNLAWVVSTILGGFGGSLIPRGSFGIDYALIAMLLCLLVFQLRDKIHAIVAIISGIIATTMALIIPGNSYIIVAAIIAATAGLLLRRKKYEHQS
ncbi:MAG TPA: branched-chain amino acid ABC transporter permease [Deltaproteobacteria bacterium]|nr:branched-chain amino acid ABC transporter permease [Deltaproteobacteria bacterium]